MKTYVLLVLSLLLYAGTIFGQKLNLNQGEVASEDYFEEVDFEFVKNKIVVPVTIDGKIYRFILDTGAPNVISKELYELLNPKLIDTISVSDAHENKETLKLVSLEKVKVGNLEFTNTASLVQEFGDNNPLKCLGLDGFLGSNMLRNSILQVDLRNKKIRITNDNKKLELKKKHSSKIMLTSSQSNPFVWIELMGEGKGKEQVLIDTGMEGLYDLSKDNYGIFEGKNIFKLISESDGASGFGLFGSPESAKQYQLLLPRMKINDFLLEDVTTVTGNDDNSRIGAELLKYGVPTIDYLNKRFYFEPYEEKTTILEMDFGFSRTLENENLIVGLVWDDTLKEKISYGDKILEINGNPFNLCELVVENNYFENENSLELKIEKSNGEIIQISVEKRPIVEKVSLDE